MAAFDIASRKINRDLSSAIFCEPNNLPQYEAPDEIGVLVQLAPLLDGLSDSTHGFVATDAFVAPGVADVEHFATILREADTDVLVNLAPAGSPRVASFWAEVALAAKCSYINATPDPVAQDRDMADRFSRANVPLLGDDLESQMGATVVHRALLETLALKGLEVTGTYQINVGGNMDFRNLSTRGDSKKQSKLRGLQLRGSQNRDNVHVTPAGGCFPFLGDRKIAHIHIEARGWLAERNSLDVQLEINDSLSAASALADLIRIAFFEREMGRGGLVRTTSFYFKSAVDKKPLLEALVDRESYLSQEG